jgi:hypothetical protein
MQHTSHAAYIMLQWQLCQPFKKTAAFEISHIAEAHPSGKMLSTDNLHQASIALFQAGWSKQAQFLVIHKEIAMNAVQA